MANEFLKPSSIKPAIVGAIADPDEYNQNIAGQSKDSVTFIDQDGLFVDGDLGDETLGATGSLITDPKFREGGNIRFYDNNGIATNSIPTSNLNNIVQATTSLRGTAEIATQSEANAGTDATKIITPSTLANFPFPDGIKLNQILTFTSSGTYSKHANLSFVIIELVGGGGGGAARNGGTGGTGGTSSFGSFVSATGGSSGNSDGSSFFNGAGGVGVGGDLNISGSTGRTVPGTTGPNQGGDSFLGRGLFRISEFAAIDNPIFGGGGVSYWFGSDYEGGAGGGGYARKVIQASSLGSSVSVTVGAAGAGDTSGSPVGRSGAAGLVIIYEFIVV